MNCLDSSGILQEERVPRHCLEWSPCVPVPAASIPLESNQHAHSACMWRCKNWCTARTNEPAPIIYWMFRFWTSHLPHGLQSLYTLVQGKRHVATQMSLIVLCTAMKKKWKRVAQPLIALLKNWRYRRKRVPTPHRPSKTSAVLLGRYRVFFPEFLERAGSKCSRAQDMSVRIITVSLKCSKSWSRRTLKVILYWTYLCCDR